MYTAFARVYDALMASVNYEKWAAHYARLMQLYQVPEKGRCVECACGTGGLTLPLRRLGYQMTGVDLSEEMLAAAMEKARSAGLSIPFVRQDMRFLALPRRAECVLATCDGVNYLASPEAAQAFFHAAYNALRPGGALIFDVSTRKNCKIPWEITPCFPTTTKYPISGATPGMKKTPAFPWPFPFLCAGKTGRMTVWRRGRPSGPIPGRS